MIFFSLLLFRLSGLAKTHGVQIKASGAMLRLRLYQSLALLPPNTYEGSFSCIILCLAHNVYNILSIVSTNLLNSNNLLCAILANLVLDDICDFDQSNYAITYSLPLPALCGHVALVNMYVRINVFL